MLYDNYEVVVKANTNWVGPGHNSIIIKDDANVDWMIYHGYQRSNTAKGRVVLMDRLVWSSDGWPTVNGLAPTTSDLLPTIKN
jgi:arabinan endo-1,5-alpha-L-arabinosidase